MVNHTAKSLGTRAISTGRNDCSAIFCCFSNELCSSPASRLSEDRYPLSSSVYHPGLLGRLCLHPHVQLWLPTAACPCFRPHAPLLCFPLLSYDMTAHSLLSVSPSNNQMKPFLDQQSRKKNPREAISVPMPTLSLAASCSQPVSLSLPAALPHSSGDVFCSQEVTFPHSTSLTSIEERKQAAAHRLQLKCSR